MWIGSVGAWLKERATQEMEARLVALVERTQVKAFNVAPRVEGGEHTLPSGGTASLSGVTVLPAG